MEVNPLSIILVKSDSKGDRLLFRYPYRTTENTEPLDRKRRNPYALTNTEDLLQSPPPPISNIYKGNYLTGFSDEVLSTLFAVKPELCNRKFELKVNDVRFVGHPTLLTPSNDTDTKRQDGLLIHIVFALRALASHSIVKCYYELSKLLGTALKHEEHRCGYVSDQNRLMAGTHDDGTTVTNSTPFDLILTRSSLAANLKQVYEDLYSNGLIKIQINGWIPIHYCLPQKVHNKLINNKILIEPLNIDKVLNRLRPYHGLLLLESQTQLIDLISLDGSPTLMRLLKMYSPLKSLQTLAADADLTLSHVYELTGHLVYWAKATIIYPLCATNKYVIAQNAPIHLNSPLVDAFYDSFPDKHLLEVISEFSLPTSLSHKTNPFAQQSQLVQMMVWMLQHHLLTQLHTYILFLPPTATTPTIEQQLSYTDDHSFSPKKYGKNIELQQQISTRSTVPSRTESESGTSTISDDLFIDSSSIHFNNNNNDDDLSQHNDKHDKHEHKHKQHNYQQHNIDDDEHNNLIDDSTSTSSSFHEQLLDFKEHERHAIFKIPASNNSEDLALLAKLCRKGYFRGEHHLEEIMYLENLRRSQLLQLLDKFRDILITYETEDPAISMY
ncbi:GATOR complex protein NPRL3 [Chrysoperla carnea]|uniref:GATOR complex protein NPRL3 n=1 Tax=Chrysoperla carnea TaxID=189513 RepID=UPI001D0867CA|nr:GATOR complex protein NPRL3 [Chrysoperla carnea]